MTEILVTGYKSFELGIFDDKDKKIGIIKKALRKDLVAYLDEGVDWFILTGNLGFEYWALEVLNELKQDYPLKTATIFPFENHGSQWNEKNQEKLALFKASDFVKFSFPSYESPQQFKQFKQFLIENTQGAYLFMIKNMKAI